MMDATTRETAELQQEIIGPQVGPQTKFGSSSADIIIYGGAAGGGKSYALLLEALRHINNGLFGAVCFRRTCPQITNEGSLWDKSFELYPHAGAKSKATALEWTFPSGARVRFAHLQHEDTVYDWQGSQIPLIMFDELTHFSLQQFFYMVSRNRSTCGVRPYVRATCNPDPDSWVASFIDWWIGEDGFPIAERDSVIRWFIRVNGVITWADSEEELEKEYPGKGQYAKSVTFIRSTIEDNKILLGVNPEYKGNLMALPEFERKILLEGNWKVKRCPGIYFKRSMFSVVEDMPAHKIKRSIRFWDRAATVPHDGNPDPDWTAGVRLGLLDDGRYIVQHVEHFRSNPDTVYTRIRNTAESDGKKTEVGLAEDPGQAGKVDATFLTRKLAGFIVHLVRESKNKALRAGPVASQAECGNILLMRGPWNETFLAELESFTGDDKGHDDMVDGLSGAFNKLAVTVSNVCGRLL